MLTAATYHVKTPGSGGSDSNTGTLASPFATPGRAAQFATATGDVIQIHEGTFTIPSSINIAIGVSVTGAGQQQTTLKGSFNDFIFKLNSTPQSRLSGNQTIENFRIDGSNKSLRGGVGVSGRNNVTIRNLTVDRTNDTGIEVWSGRIPGNTGPNEWLTGIKIHNCTLTNTARDVTSVPASNSYTTGAIQIGHLDGAEIYNNVIVDDAGYGIKMRPKSSWGWYKRCKIHNNDITVNEGNRGHPAVYQWGPDIGIELWNLFEDNEVYQNNINNGLSFVHGNRGAGINSVVVYENRIVANTNDFVGNAVELHIADALIDNNYIGNRIRAMNLNRQAGNTVIRNNVFHDVVGNRIRIGLKVGETVDNIDIFHNVFHNQNIIGISGQGAVFADNGRVSNLSFRNNICIADNGPEKPVNLWAGADTTGRVISHNSFHVPGYDASDLPTGSNNNIFGDPGLLRSGQQPFPYYYPASTGSAVVGAGVDVGFGYGPSPDIGPFQFEAPVPSNSEYSLALAHWKFDENSGTTAADSSGNGNNATVNSPAWVAGASGASMRFNNSSTAVFAPDSSSLDVSGNRISLTAWVSLNSTVGRRQFISKSVYELGQNYGRLTARFILDDGSMIEVETTSVVLNPDGVFHHVGVVRLGNSVKLYLDGVSQSVTFLKGPSAIDQRKNSSRLEIGRRTGGLSITGAIDEPAVFDIALSSSQMTNLADISGAVTQTMDLKFPEGSGTTTADSSPNGMTGTLSGATWVGFEGGNALSFNGSASVDFPHTAALSLGGNTLAICATVRPTSVTGRKAILTKGVYELQVNYGRLLLLVVLDDGTRFESQTVDPVLSPDVRYDVGVARIGSDVRFYVDGTEVPSTILQGASSNPVRENSADVTVGRRSNGSLGFQGIIDNVELFADAVDFSN